MFEIKETDKGIELYCNNSEEHAKTGVTLRDFTWPFTVDEWFQFTKEVMKLADKMYPKAEPEPKPEPEAEVEEESEFKGRADEIIDTLTEFGPLTYNELAEKMDITYKRAARLVSQMVRDGVNLKREGKPRKVSIG